MILIFITISLEYNILLYCMMLWWISKDSGVWTHFYLKRSLNQSERRRLIDCTDIHSLNYIDVTRGTL